METQSEVFGSPSRNTFERMLPGYAFLLPLLAQVFFMNPCYEKSINVKLIRAALMPITAYLALSRIGLRLFYPLEAFFHWNFACVSFPTFHAVCLAIQFGIFQGSVFGTKKELIEKGNYRGEGHEKEEKTVEPSNSVPSFLEKIKFAIWLLFSPRGLQTSWAPSLEVVPRGPKMSIGRFVAHTLRKAVFYHVMTTITWAICVEIARHPQKAHGVLADHVPGLKFLKTIPQYDYIFTMPFGVLAWFAIDTLGCVLNLLEAMVYLIGPSILPKDLSPGNFDSTLYPELFNELNKRESLIAFWSKGWHAIFRRNIILCGWRPVEFIFLVFGKDAGKMGGMMGGMLFSGLFHEFVVAAASRIDPHFRTMKMFAVCGLGMVAEVQFKRRTGRLVQGIFGRIWLTLILAFFGKDWVLSWIDRGLARNEIAPPGQWRWPRFLVPFAFLFPERWISALVSCI